MNECWSLKGPRFVSHIFGRRKDERKLLSRTPPSLARAASRLGEAVVNRPREDIEFLTNKYCA